MRHLIFDFGGVFVQLNRNRAVQAFRDLGLCEADSLLDSYLQRGIFLDLETGRISAEVYLAELSRLCGKELSYEEVEQAWLAFMDPVSLPLLDYIASLRDSYRICLLSNTNPFIMNWARSSRFSKAGLPLDAYCDRLFLSYQMGCVKPDPQIFEKMIREENIIPEESVFIDDSETNLLSSKRFGFQTFCPKPEEGAGWISRFSEFLNKSVSLH